MTQAASRPTTRTFDQRPISPVLGGLLTQVSLVALMWALAVVAVLGQVVVYLAHAAVILPYPFDIDQGEGYDVNAGLLLASGRPIYTDNETYPYFSSNYPPVYSVVVALASGLWGPSLTAGRMVSLLATLALGVLIFLAAQRRSNGIGGLFGAGFFFLSNYVFHVTPLARVNALTALLALAALLAFERRNRTGTVLGTGLLLAAVYTKPTAIDAVAAGLLALFLRDRGLALRVAGALVLTGGAVALALEVATQRAFSLNVLLGNVNPFIPEQLRDYLVNFTLLHAVPLFLAGWVSTKALVAGRLDGVHLFLLTGSIMALGVGKWGAGESYFLSTITASSVLAGEAAGRLVRARHAGANLLPALILVQCLVSAHGIVVAQAPMLVDRGLQAKALAAEPSAKDLDGGYGIVTLLQAHEGPSLLEDPGFAVAAGREVVGNATHLRNLHQAGLWRGDALVADVRSRRYHTVVLDAELYPEPVLVAVGRAYFLFDVVNVAQATQKVFLPGAL